MSLPVVSGTPSGAPSMAAVEATPKAVRLPAASGLAGIVAVVIGADVWAIHTGRPTISATVADTLDHPVGGPVVIGVLAALGWHLVADPVLRRLAKGVASESAG